MNEAFEGVIRGIFGGEIPDVPEIYNEGRKFYSPESINYEMVPYIMMALYTEDDMKMIIELPASEEEIAKATGFEKEYVKERMDYLVGEGMAMAAPFGYARMPKDIVVAMDFLYFAQEGKRKPLTLKTTLTLLLMVMSCMCEFFEEFSTTHDQDPV